MAFIPSMDIGAVLAEHAARLRAGNGGWGAGIAARHRSQAARGV